MPKAEGEGGSAEEDTVFCGSLGSVLEKVKQTLLRNEVKLALDILQRNRRDTSFLVEVEGHVQRTRRKAACLLVLIKGFPVVRLQTAETLNGWMEGIPELLKHIAGKFGGSIF